VGRGGEGHSHVAWLLLPLLPRSDRVVAAPASFRYFGRSPALSAVSAGCLSRRSGYASPLLGRIREGWGERGGVDMVEMGDPRWGLWPTRCVPLPPRPVWLPPDDRFGVSSRHAPPAAVRSRLRGALVGRGGEKHSRVAVLPPPLLLLRSDRVVIALVSCRYLGRLRPPRAVSVRTVCRGAAGACRHTAGHVEGMTCPHCHTWLLTGCTVAALRGYPLGTRLAGVHRHHQSIYAYPFLC
jgi:hypothetical protein